MWRHAIEGFDDPLEFTQRIVDALVEEDAVHLMSDLFVPNGDLFVSTTIGHGHEGMIWMCTDVAPGVVCLVAMTPGGSSVQSNPSPINHRVSATSEPNHAT
jgi:hypothetical protein